MPNPGTFCFVYVEFLSFAFSMKLLIFSSCFWKPENEKENCQVYFFCFNIWWIIRILQYIRYFIPFLPYINLERLSLRKY